MRSTRLPPRSPAEAPLSPTRAASVRPVPRPVPPPEEPALDADALRRLILASSCTPVAEFLSKGCTLEDYRSAIWMYVDRYVKTGSLESLSKAIVKAAALRSHLLDHPVL